MKTKFASHYKFSLSKKLLFLISAIFATLLLAGTAFAISQMATADENNVSEPVSNYTVLIQVEGPGKVDASSYAGYHIGQVYVRGTTLYIEETEGTLRKQDTCRTEGVGEGAEFQGWFLSDGTKIGTDPINIGSGTVTITVRYKAMRYLSFGQGEHGKIIVKNSKGEIRTDNKLSVELNSACTFDYHNTITFYNPKHKTQIEGTVENVPDSGYYLASWSPALPEKVTESVDYVSTFKMGYKVNVVWDKDKGDILHPSETMPLIPFYVEKGNEMMPYYEGNNALVFYADPLTETDSIYADAKNDFVFDGWYQNGIKLKEEFYDINSDIEIEARFVNLHNDINFSVARGQESQGKVTVPIITKDYGTNYNIDGDTIFFNGVAGSKAEPFNPEEYVFDCWTIDNKVVSGEGIVIGPINFVAHFKPVNTWKIYGQAKYQSSTGEAPAPDTKIFYYYEDVQSSKTYVISDTVSDSQGNYALFIPNEITEGYLDAMHDSLGVFSVKLNKPEATEVYKDVVLAKDSESVYLYGQVTENNPVKTPLWNVDVAFNYKDELFRFMSTATNQQGYYYLKISKSKSGGTIIALGSGYILCYNMISSSDMADKSVLRYDFCLSTGYNNTFKFEDEEKIDSYEISISVDAGWGFRYSSLKEDLKIAVPTDPGNSPKFDLDKNKVSLSYYDFTYRDIEIKYEIRPIPNSSCFMDHWIVNGKDETSIRGRDITSHNTFVPFCIATCNISGLVTEKLDDGSEVPLEGADVVFTDEEFNIIQKTTTSSLTNKNYYLNRIPQGTSGYFLALKDNYKPAYMHISSPETSVIDLEINVSLQKSEEGDDAFIFGQVSEDQAGTSVPVHNANVYYFGEDSSLVAATTTTEDGFYLLKVPYWWKGNLVCFADGYKPYIEKLDINKYVYEKNILLDKNIQNINASFKFVENQNKYEFEVLSKDGMISYGAFYFREDITLQFEINTRYALTKDEIHFLYGDYIIRVKSHQNNGWAFEKWNIDPAPTAVGTLKEDSSFSPKILKGRLVDATWDSDYGIVQSTMQTLPYYEVEGSYFQIKSSNIKLNGTELFANEKPNGMFIGWYLNDVKLDDGTYKITDNINFEARFVKMYHNISFSVAKGQEDIGQVDKSLIENVKYGSDYTVDLYKVYVGGQTVTATAKDSQKYELDYWTINGQKAEPSGIVTESLHFVAHFKERNPWHVKGQILRNDGDAQTPVNGAYVFAVDFNSPTTFISETYSDENGNYELSILHPYAKVSITALHAEFGHGTVDVGRPDGEEVIQNITLQPDPDSTYIYGQVTKEGTESPLEGIDVVYVYDNGEDPIYAQTSKDGSYILKVDKTKACSGSAYFYGEGYKIKSHSFDYSKISSNFLINYDEALKAELIQTIIWKGDGLCSSVKLTLKVEQTEIFMKDYTETLSIGVPYKDAKLLISGNTVTFKFKGLDNSNIEYKIEEATKEGCEVMYWLLNGEPVYDGSEIDITKANELQPFVQALCKISGNVKGKDESSESPLAGVEVIFYDQNNRIIDSATSNLEGKWQFKSSICQGTAGNIVFLKEGYKPKLEEITSEQTTKPSLNIETTLDKSEDVDDYYVYGHITKSSTTNAEAEPIPYAYIMFYNTSDHSVCECYAGADGAYLLNAPKEAEGYLLAMADGYKPEFTYYKFDTFVKVQDFGLAKYPVGVNVNFPFGYNQKCFKIEVLNPQTYESYAEFNYYGSLNLNFNKGQRYFAVNDYVTILGENYTYRFTAVPEDTYDFYEWVISSGSSTGILSDDTSFTPTFVYQTSPVLLNPGTAVKGFHYVYYLNDEEIWNEYEDYVQDDSYVNTVITVNEDGIIESHFNIAENNGENEVDLWSKITPQVEEGYIFDALYVNDEVLKPGDELIVKDGEYYFGEINYKLPPQPDPPSPTPDDPEFVNGGQTGDDSLAIVIGLFGIIVLAGTSTFVIRKKQIK